MLPFKRRLVLWVFITFKQVYGSERQSEEPSCYSRFDYEYKLLTKVVALESSAAKFEDMISHLQQKIDETSKRLATQNKLLKELSGTSGGSTYTRWGRTTCNANGTETVYSGYAAGSSFKHKGAAVNYLCLTKEPLYSRFDDRYQTGGAFVYGAEYRNEFGNRYLNTFYDNTDYSASCAVCQSPRSRVLMIPGRNKCLGGWTFVYEGYLVAGEHEQSAASEFICLDSNPESLPNDSGDNTKTMKNENGKLLNTHMKLFVLSESRCGGSLKCPPYFEGRELTCVVCTK